MSRGSVEIITNLIDVASRKVSWRGINLSSYAFFLSKKFMVYVQPVLDVTFIIPAPANLVVLGYALSRHLRRNGAILSVVIPYVCTAVYIIFFLAGVVQLHFYFPIQSTSVLISAYGNFDGNMNTRGAAVTEPGQYAPSIAGGQPRPTGMAFQPVPLGGPDMQGYPMDDEEMMRLKAERGSRAGGWSAELNRKRALEEAFSSIWI